VPAILLVPFSLQTGRRGFFISAGGGKEHGGSAGTSGTPSTEAGVGSSVQSGVGSSVESSVGTSGGSNTEPNM